MTFINNIFSIKHSGLRILLTAISITYFLPALLYGSPKDKTVLVKAVQVKPVSEYIIRSFPGKVVSKTESSLSFRIAGKILDLPSDIIGKKFEKDDVIAQLDSHDVRVSVEQATSALAETEANQANSESIYIQNKELWADNSISEREFINSRELWKSAKDKVAQQKSILIKAEDQLKYTRLTAPFSGYVANRFVRQYDLVKAGQPIVEFIDASTLEVTAGIPIRYYQKKDSFFKYECVFSALPDLKISASLKNIGCKALPPTNTYPLTVTIPESNKDLFAGMNASVIVYIKRETSQVGTIDIPVSAIVSGPGKESFIWIYDSKRKTVSKRQIMLGQMTATGVEVIKGLHSKEWIITAGANKLHNDQKVRIR